MSDAGPEEVIQPRYMEGNEFVRCGGVSDQEADSMSRHIAH